MNKCLSVLSCALLVACSAPKIDASHHEKTIDVRVSSGIIKVDDDPALATAAQGVIKWELDSSAVSAGFRFPSNGIEFDPRPPAAPIGCRIGDPVKAFHNCSPKQQGKEFHCNRKPNNFESDACYKYIVRLKGSSADPPALDPWVRNER